MPLQAISAEAGILGLLEVVVAGGARPSGGKGSGGGGGRRGCREYQIRSGAG